MKARVVACIAIAVAGAALAQEAVRRESKTLLVRRASGPREKYAATWTADLAVRKWESGGPSTPLQGKWIDDRQCHWTIHAAVDRRLYLLNADGQRLENGETATSLAVPVRGQGSLGVDTKDNCNEAEARFRADVRDAEAAVNQSFGAVVDRDWVELIKVIRGWKGVTEVVPEPK